MKELNHKNIATYHDNGFVTVETNRHDEIKIPWIAMEICGRNLERYIEEAGPLSLELVIKIGVQMCEALDHFHSKGFIHRDIKPANFVWAKNEEKSNIKMIDFGIGKRTGEDVAGRPFDNFTQLKEFVGPVFFSSPELIAYSQDITKKYPVDNRSDIFQLGKVFWYLATAKVSAGVPSKKGCPELYNLVMDMIQDDPDERIQTAKEVKDILLSL
jgi:serine/threonine-protein kinase